MFMTSAAGGILVFDMPELKRCDARPCANAAEWSATSESARRLRLVQCTKNGPEKSGPLVESISLGWRSAAKARVYATLECARPQSPKRARSPLRTAIAALFISNRSIDGQEAAEQGAGGNERDGSSLGHLVPFSRLRRNSASSSENNLCIPDTRGNAFVCMAAIVCLHRNIIREVWHSR